MIGAQLSVHDLISSCHLAIQVDAGLVIKYLHNPTCQDIASIADFKDFIFGFDLGFGMHLRTYEAAKAFDHILITYKFKSPM